MKKLEKFRFMCKLRKHTFLNSKSDKEETLKKMKKNFWNEWEQT
jgi:hypothetical protein